jgi:hypothetical protein
MFSTGVIGSLAGCNQSEARQEPVEGSSKSSPKPADIAVTNLSLNQSTVDAGGSVGISVELENRGGERGRERIIPTVDGDELERQDVTLRGGQSTTLNFSTKKVVPGTYTVTVGGIETTFEVHGTEVGGVLDSDTTWTKAESPYSITNTVQVEKGVKHTIEPGVTILGSEDLSYDPMFLVHGEIAAEGSKSEMITIDGGFEHPTVFSAENSTPEAFVEASYCRIRTNGPFWMHGHGGFNLRHSELHNVDSSYIWYPYQDIDDEYDILEPEINIEYNKFINASGFSIGHDKHSEDDITVNIRNNAFSGWKEASGGGLINNWNSVGDSQTIVEYNSFLDMTDKVVLKLRSGSEKADMTAQNNYWDTTNTDKIEEMIYDENDDINVANEIEYTPVLQKPHPDTPTI